MYGDFSRLLDLATIQGGQLNDDFMEHYKDVLSTLKKGENGKITINITLRRPADMDTMVSIETDIRSRKPKRARAQYGVIAADEHGQVALKVDAPKPKLEPVPLFKASEE